MVLQIWNTGPNPQRRRQRICEQSLGRDDGTHERRAHQNVTSSPTMQFSSGSFQQNREEISGVICGRDSLNWETFLPALALSYNTSYHSTIATTPFELIFGEKARLPSFPNENIQKVHYGETSAAERFNLLQKLRKLAHDNATVNGEKTKEQYDKKSMPHNFQIGNKVLIANDYKKSQISAKLERLW
jgi:hypothetical protein